MIQLDLQNRKRLADLENEPKAAGGRDSQPGKVLFPLLYSKYNRQTAVSTASSGHVTWQPGREGLGERVHGCARLRPSAVCLKLPENC